MPPEKILPKASLIEEGLPEEIPTEDPESRCNTSTPDSPAILPTRYSSLPEERTPGKKSPRRSNETPEPTATVESECIRVEKEKLSEEEMSTSASYSSLPDYHPSMASIWLVPVHVQMDDDAFQQTPQELIPARDPHDTRHTLVIDIDDTLISSGWMYGETNVTALRPNVIPFLREMHELFEVIYWTAAVEEYGRAVLQAIEAIGKAIDGKSVCGANPKAMYRQHCLEDWNDMKYLPLLKRPVQNVLIIDDSRKSFRMTPRQGVKMQGWSPSPREVMRYLPAAYRQEFFRCNQPVAYEDLPPLPTEGKVSTASLADRSFDAMRSMLIHCAKSKNPSLEMDYWRPDDYGTTDDFSSLYMKGNHPYGPGPGCTDAGDWLPLRRLSPISPLNRNTYLDAFNNVRNEFADSSYYSSERRCMVRIVEFLGEPDAIMGCIEQ